jgi:hypothetical protein
LEYRKKLQNVLKKDYEFSSYFGSRGALAHLIKSGARRSESTQMVSK